MLAVTSDKTRLHLELYYLMAKAFREIAREAGVENITPYYKSARITQVGKWARRIEVDL